MPDTFAFFCALISEDDISFKLFKINNKRKQSDFRNKKPARKIAKSDHLQILFRLETRGLRGSNITSKKSAILNCFCPRFLPLKTKKSEFKPWFKL